MNRTHAHDRRREIRANLFASGFSRVDYTKDPGTGEYSETFVSELGKITIEWSPLPQRTYRIIRCYLGGQERTAEAIMRGLSREDAIAHCAEQNFGPEYVDGYVLEEE